jgi:HlyD family type I secretion membrane fusion protein
VRELYRKGYERKPRMLELQRTEAGLLGTEGELVSQSARGEEGIGEARLEIINTTIRRREEVDRDLSQVQSDRLELEQQITESLDRLSRTRITAPVDGIVLHLQVKTLGGVIKPGEAIMDLVPTTEDLIIDAQVSTRDIDAVHAGQPAYVMFPSYPQRNLARVPGQVRTVSADSLQDQRTGERFYTVKIKVDRAELKALDPDIELTPGLPAETYITTGVRTWLNYLLQPLLMMVERTMRER